MRLIQKIRGRDGQERTHRDRLPTHQLELLESRTLLSGSLLSVNALALNDGIAIISGQEISASLNESESTHYYTFTAQAGSGIRATMGEVSGVNFSPHLSLYSPSGVLLASDTNGTGAAVETVAPESGNYLLTASELDGDTGTYTLGLIAASNATTEGPRGGVIISGQERGGLLPAGALDVYTFTAEAGSGIRATMGEVSGVNFSPHLNLYSPSGVLLASDTDGTGAAVEALAPETGTYYLAASELNGDVGTYTLGLIAASNPTVDGLRGGVIISGQERGGLLPAGALDVYTFSAEAGSGIRATMGEISGVNFSPYLNLYSPSGVLLASDTDGAGVAVEAVAPETGIYYLAASELNGDAGTYKVGLIAASNATAEGLRGGLIVSGEERGGFLPAGALDVYTFEAQAGGGIRATMGEVSGFNFSPQLNLYSPNGVLLASNWGSQGAAVEAVAPVTGTYYLAASDQDGGGEGAYELSSTFLTNSPFTSVTLITHGFGSDTYGWINDLRNAIDDYTIAPDPTYRVIVYDDGLFTGPIYVDEPPISLNPVVSSYSDHLILLLDWAPLAGKIDVGDSLLGGYHRSTIDVASVVAPKLFEEGFIDGWSGRLTDLPMHFIGHSRGASLVVAIADELNDLGVTVDHLTTLDPHPVDGVYGDDFIDWDDRTMSLPNNVVFADNYWREDPLFPADFDGEFVSHAINYELFDDQLEGGFHANILGLSVETEHSDVPLWYLGTALLDDELPEPPNAYEFDTGAGESWANWYGSSHPERNQAGYRHSSIARAAGYGAGTDILPGQEVQGDLAEGEGHFYTFEAQAGGGIRATMGEVSGSAFSPHLNLYSPTGVLLASDWGSSGAVVEAVAPVTGTYYLSASELDGDDGTYTLTSTFELAFAATITSRHAFYNGSYFDGTDAGASAADDAAIASDKQALLPGQTATFANYSSYSKGLNGLMVDVAELSSPGSLSAADFAFKTGNSDDPSGWSAAPAPLSVTVREGEGVGGSDRVTVIWAANDLDGVVEANEAVAKGWLEVTVLATGTTGLAEADVFYFGNAVGETGDSASHAQVNALDAGGVRDNPHNFLNPAGLIDAYDINRDQRVDAIDYGLVRDNATNFLNDLNLITPPAPEAPASTAEATVSAEPSTTPTLAATTTSASAELVAAPTASPTTTQASTSLGEPSQSSSPTASDPVMEPSEPASSSSLSAPAEAPASEPFTPEFRRALWAWERQDRVSRRSSGLERLRELRASRTLGDNDADSDVTVVGNELSRR